MTTIQYPRGLWDQQRASFLDAVQRSRLDGRIEHAVVGLVTVCAGLLMSGRQDEVLNALLLVVVVTMVAGSVARSLRRKRGHRRVVEGLREVLDRAGHGATADQAGILLGLGCCWLTDHRYLEADLSDPGMVVLRVVEPPRDTLAAGMFGSAGGSGLGGDGGGGGC